MLISTLETVGKDLIDLRNRIHEFYYKILPSKPKKETRSDTIDTVPSIWDDIEIDSEKSPLAESLATNFKFNTEYNSDDLRKIYDFADPDIYPTTQREKIIKNVISIKQKIPSLDLHDLGAKQRLNHTHDIDKVFDICNSSFQ